MAKYLSRARLRKSQKCYFSGRLSRDSTHLLFTQGRCDKTIDDLFYHPCDHVCNLIINHNVAIYEAFSSFIFILYFLNSQKLPAGASPLTAVAAMAMQADDDLYAFSLPLIFGGIDILFPSTER